MQFTQEQIEALAKELCFYSENEIGCSANCKNCDLQGTWKEYKIRAVKVARLWEKIRGK